MVEHKALMGIREKQKYIYVHVRKCNVPDIVGISKEKDF